MTDFPAVASAIGNISSVSYDKGSESSSTAQISAQTPEGNDAVPTVDVANVMPDFPGGMVGAMQAIMSEVKWPSVADPEDGYDGLAVVGFTVMADGSVANIALLKSCGNDDLDAEAKRAVSAAFADKKWTPGQVDGKLVNCKLAIPIRFTTKPQPKNGNDAPNK